MIINVTRMVTVTEILRKFFLRHKRFKIPNIDSSTYFVASVLNGLKSISNSSCYW